MSAALRKAKAARQRRIFRDAKKEALEAQRERAAEHDREILVKLGVRCPACGSCSMTAPSCGNSRHPAEVTGPYPDPKGGNDAKPG